MKKIFCTFVITFILLLPFALVGDSITFNPFTGKLDVVGTSSSSPGPSSGVSDITSNDLSVSNDGSGNYVIDAGDTIAKRDETNLFASNTAFTGSATQTLAAGTTVLCNATKIAINSSGNVTLTANPIIADPTNDGTMCIVQNVDSADTITFTSGTAYNLKLNSSTIALGPGERMTLNWDTTTSLWVQEKGSTGSGTTEICSGGTSTPSTQSTEPSAGVSPAFTCTIPANTFNATGKVVKCNIRIDQTDGGVGGHQGVLNLRHYVDGVATGATVTDGNASWSSTFYNITIMQKASGGLSLDDQAMGSSGTSTGSGGNPSPTLSADFNIEFRPWMTTINDDSFTVAAYSCKAQ